MLRVLGFRKPKTLHEFKKNNSLLQLDSITKDKYDENGDLIKGRNPTDNLSNFKSERVLYAPHFVFDLANFYFNNKGSLT